MDMTRRNFLELTTIAGVANLTPASRLVAGEQRPPNIILMLGDDHRADVLGCMGNPIVQTPQLDRLARNGVIFENHFCTTPICCASRASIMLGQYAATTGIYAFATNLSPEQIEQTYWMRLKEAGYHIGFVGKFGVGGKMLKEAFDVWKGFSGQGTYFPKGPDGPHLTDIMRDHANEFLENAPQDKPFCLSISFKAPHVEDPDPRQYLPSNDTLSLYKDVMIPTPRGAGMEDIRRLPLAIQRSENRRRWGIRFSTPELYQASMKGYYRLVTGIDMAIASIRKTLEKQGLADNTIIVYSADHGIFNGEHGFAGKWYGYEESLRIPLIIYDPRLPAGFRGRRKQAMTLNIDLHPTILEMANLEPSESVQGRSLVPLLRENQPNARRIWFFEHHYPLNGFIPSSEGIRTQRWKYIRYTDVAAPYEELYDLRHDPSEIRNLAGQPHYAAQQHALTAYWQRWRDSLHGASGSWTDPIQEPDLVHDGLI